MAFIPRGRLCTTSRLCSSSTGKEHFSQIFRTRRSTSKDISKVFIAQKRRSCSLSSCNSRPIKVLKKTWISKCRRLSGLFTFLIRKRKYEETRHHRERRPHW